MAKSDDAAVQHAIFDFIRQNIVGVSSTERASSIDDRLGTDYWATLNSGKRLSLDVKIRDEDYTLKDPPQDDLALELWSVIGKKTGWTRDSGKQTDFILWYWKDSGRICMLSFPILCSVFQEKAAEWTEEFSDGVRTQTTVNAGQDSYQSQCIFVPRKIVLQAMLTKFGGKPAAKQAQAC